MGRDAIFDAHTTDTDAGSYRTLQVSNVLELQEKEKKGKYLWNRLKIWKDFTTLVYLVDRVAGREAWSAEKRLATLLKVKWNREYAKMVYYVEVRVQLSLVHTASLLIQGSRNHQRHRPYMLPDWSAISDWQTRQER